LLTRWGQWGPEQRRAFLAQLDEQERARLLELIEAHRARRRWETPGELAVAVDPATVQTPALDLIDEAIVWAYTTRGARLIISIAPQEGKSERVTKTGSLWALSHDPERRIGIVSYAQSLAESFGRSVRNWITTFDGTERTLDLGLRIARDYGSAKRWQLDGHRGGIICAGIGSGINGRPLDALVIDDPFSGREEADSAYYRQRVWDWWTSTGSTRLAPGAPVVLINTRWHEDDFAGRLTAAEDGHRWRVINIPALADHDPGKGQSDPLGREPGEWLESARGRTVTDWEQIRIQAGSRDFTALYQGRPSPDKGNVWQRQWWRFYQSPLWSQHPDIPAAWLVDADELVISVDAAFKDTKSSDFVVMQVWARRGAMVFLLDQVRKRLSFTDTLTALLALVAKWPQAARKLIEDKANGTAVISSLKSKVPGLVPVNPTDSKYGRATAVAPFVESGNVQLPAPEIALFDAAELVEEAAGFPNGAHDDMVDATSQALAEMLLDGTGAMAWIAWAKRKAEEAAAGPAPEPRESAGPEPGASPELPGPQADVIPLDPVAARKAARDAAYRARQGAY
jgi:predicted phage terminase large subunit-like protein